MELSVPQNYVVSGHLHGDAALVTCELEAFVSDLATDAKQKVDVDEMVAPEAFCDCVGTARVIADAMPNFRDRKLETNAASNGGNELQYRVLNLDIDRELVIIFSWYDARNPYAEKARKNRKVKFVVLDFDKAEKTLNELYDSGWRVVSQSTVSAPGGGERLAFVLNRAN